MTAPGKRDLLVRSVAVLGVVYGDIGTSPLYAVRACFFGKHAVDPTEANVLGILSLITWSLLLVISVKYLAFILRADHDGEGGILALMELVRLWTRGRLRRFVLVAGFFGAALLYGDGMITPAISVLSAIEGLRFATPVFSPYVVPITLGVLLLLFSVQRLGTGSVGRLFGPVMTVWFLVLAVSGVAALVQVPGTLRALDPRLGIGFLAGHGVQGFAVLSFVFLVVTGGEALYADIGHFGKLPIRVGWYSLVLPALLLNYWGQGALLLAEGGDVRNPFYQLMPGWALYPMVGLATFATVIASQAIISGTFSLTFQAFQLGYLPRLTFHHTSLERRGQIYVPVVNWILFAAAAGLVFGFRESADLAAAYGVAISVTMTVTTVLFFLAMRRVYRWPRAAAVGLAVLFLVVDTVYLAANLGKFPDGGWFPILIAAGVFWIMATWRKGQAASRRKMRNRRRPVRQFLRDIGGGGKYRRVPGQAVYVTEDARGTPFSLRHNLEHNHALHALVVIYTATFVKAPYVDPGARLQVTCLREHDLWRIVAHYGYLESPDVPRDLERARAQGGPDLDPDRVTYLVGGHTPVVRDHIGMGRLRSWLYAILARNEQRASLMDSLPSDRVLEVGGEVEV